jgi:glycosyltransferase involved in cell wall biosynthesis
MQNGGAVGPLVSVVIPTYNRAYCLAGAVDSALGQTHRHVEVIVVDDGSTDGTPELMEERYGGDGRVRYVRQPNQGTNIARNHGLALARGELVALLDSDDTFLPHKLEIQIACLRAFPDAGMIWTDMDALDAEGRIVPRYLRRMYSNYQRFSTEQIFATSRPLAEVVPHLPEIAGDARIHFGDIFSPMVMGNLVHTSTSLIRRERLAKVRGFDEKLVRSGVDFDFHLRTCREGPVAYADIPTIHYRIGLADQMTHPSRRVKMAENFLRTISPVLLRDRARLTLTQRQIEELLGEAEAFLGEAYLDADQHATARTHLLGSLRHLPLQPRVASLLLLSLLPPSSKPPLRRVYRMARGLSHDGAP